MLAGRRASVRLGLTVTALALLSSACGTRVDHSSVVAGAGGGPVRLSPQTLAQLHPADLPAPAGATTTAASASLPTASTAQAPTVARAAAAPVAAAPVAAAPVAAAPTSTAPAARSAPGVAAAPATPSATKANAAVCPAAAAPIALGQVGTFSGLAGPILAAARSGLAVWAKGVNARGGLACHPVTVYSEDDGGDPSRAAFLVKQLVADRHVVAFVGSVTPLSAGGFIPALEQAQVPEVGGLIGSDRAYSSPWVYSVGPGLDGALIGLIRNGVDSGQKRLGFLHCVEASVCQVFADKLHGPDVGAAGAQLAYDATISITQPDFTAQCLNARSAGVDQLMVLADGASLARVARSCSAIGYRPLLSTSAEVLSPQDAKDQDLRSFGVATITAEAPWILSDSTGLAEYHRVLAGMAGDGSGDAESMTAWVAAKLLESAVANLGERARSGPLTPALVVDGLGRVHGDTLGGLTPPVTFSPGQKGSPGNGCVYDERLDKSGWTAPRGSRAVCVGTRQSGA